MTEFLCHEAMRGYDCDQRSRRSLSRLEAAAAVPDEIAVPDEFRLARRLFSCASLTSMRLCRRDRSRSLVVSPFFRARMTCVRVGKGSRHSQARPAPPFSSFAAAKQAAVRSTGSEPRRRLVAEESSHNADRKKKQSAAKHAPKRKVIGASSRPPR
jgi:hypothetical protein